MLEQKISRDTLNMKKISLFAVLFIALLFPYGLIPHVHINSLPAYYGMFSDTQALLNNGILNFSYVKNFGIDLGSPFVQGLPFTYCAAFISYVSGISVHTSVFLTGIFFLFIAFFSMTYLLRVLGVETYIALVCSYVFLILPINYGQMGYGTMMYGFILLPFSVLVDFLLFKQFLKKGIDAPFVIMLVLYPIEKIFFLFLDGYAFVISSAASITMFLFCSMHYWKHGDNVLSKHQISSAARIKKFMIGASVFFVAHLLAVILYKMYVPGGGSYMVMPIDFFRAQGIDLISLFLPSQGFYFLDLIGVTRRWDGLAFYGDGSNVAANYIGFVLFIVFVSYLVSTAKKELFVKAMLMAGGLSLILSLGPSLKINNKKTVLVNKAIEFSDYLMPAKDATLDLHTGFIYQKIPGINNMRAVSRWMLLFLFSVVIGAALFLSDLARKKPVLASILVLLIVIELHPNVFAEHATYVSNYRQKNDFDKVVKSMSPYVNANDKIFFLSNENDYLANYISVQLNSRSYNVAGDKNQILSEKYWPESIKNLRAFRQINDNAVHAMSANMLDKLIIPFFNLRWNAYAWPPSEENRIQNRAFLLSKISIDDPRIIFKEEKWFGVISLNRGDDRRNVEHQLHL